MIADAMEQFAAKLEKLDIAKFKADTERYSCVASNIFNCDDEEKLNGLLVSAYKEFGIDIPWKGDFDSFMGDRSNRLVFG